MPPLLWWCFLVGLARRLVCGVSASSTPQDRVGATCPGRGHQVIRWGISSGVCSPLAPLSLGCHRSLPYLQQVLFGTPAYTSYLSRKFKRFQGHLAACGVDDSQLTRSWWSQYWLERKSAEATDSTSGGNHTDYMERDFLASTSALVCIAAMIFNESKQWGVEFPGALQVRCLGVIDCLASLCFMEYRDARTEYDGGAISFDILQDAGGQVVVSGAQFPTAAERKYCIQNIFPDAATPLSRVLANLAHLLLRPSRISAKRKMQLQSFFGFSTGYIQSIVDLSREEEWWDGMSPLGLPDLEGPKRQGWRLIASRLAHWGHCYLLAWVCVSPLPLGVARFLNCMCVCRGSYFDRPFTHNMSGNHGSVAILNLQLVLWERPCDRGTQFPNQMHPTPEVGLQCEAGSRVGCRRAAERQERGGIGGRGAPSSVIGMPPRRGARGPGLRMRTSSHSATWCTTWMPASR